MASIARADISVIGTWKDDIRIDQEAVAAYIGGEIAPNAGAHTGRDWGPFDIQKEVIALCPTDCMGMDDGKLVIDNRECNRCMHCINVMPRALRIGKDTGLSMLVGAKAPIGDSPLDAQIVLAVSLVNALLFTVLTALTGFSRLLSLAHVFWTLIALFPWRPDAADEGHMCITGFPGRVARRCDH